MKSVEDQESAIIFSLVTIGVGVQHKSWKPISFQALEALEALKSPYLARLPALQWCVGQLPVSAEVASMWILARNLSLTLLHVEVDQTNLQPQKASPMQEQRTHFTRQEHWHLKRMLQNHQCLEATVQFPLHRLHLTHGGDGFTDQMSL